ncbi:hypothetical protein [Streptomyces sp. NPDC058335]|uniref:hypothetical protein n=1 Tax=Streptomyces sp. NPDC058335 TaxID=3346451 RepID=UPI003660F53D
MGRAAIGYPMAVIGVGTDGRPVTVDLDGAPYVLVSTCGSGGSSTILRTLTAQILHHGATPWSSTTSASPSRGRASCRR